MHFSEERRLLYITNKEKKNVFNRNVMPCWTIIMKVTADLTTIIDIRVGWQHAIV